MRLFPGAGQGQMVSAFLTRGLCADLLGALIRYRGDKPQAERLEQWLAEVLQTYSDRLLHLDGENFASCGVRLLNPYQAC